jgi:hypothetical protein
MEPVFSITSLSVIIFTYFMQGTQQDLNVGFKAEICT